MTGTVNRVEPRAIILDVGKNVEAILATTEQSMLEHYRIGQNVKAFVLEVRRSTKGPQIFVSRTHKGFLKRLFELEVPEIHSGTVEIKAIAREAGSRSKVAVASRQDGLDPVGATVGQRGARVQAVVAELSGEKIDVIPWSDDASVFVANALSPAQVISVDIDEEHRIASVTVPERMLSLAIGREGQNARLAARLTGWRIDIRSDVSVAEARAAAADAATNGTAAEQVEDTEARGRRGDRHRGAPPRPPRRRRARREAEARDQEGRRAPRPPRPTQPPRPRRPAPADGDRPGRQAQARLEEEGSRHRTHRGGGVVAGASGSVAPRRTPDRTCVACRTVRPKRDLQRIVRTPTGEIVADETGRAAGRGAYVCRTGTLPRHSPRQGRPEPGAQDPAPARRASAARREPDDRRHHTRMRR